MNNHNLSQRTVVLLTKDSEVLLGYKKTGFGKRKYLGIGGKVEPGETIEQAAVREVEEEVSVIKPVLKAQGDLTFLFPEKPAWSQQVHVFVSKEWQGEPVESQEIRPEWFSHNQLPLDNMWDDARYWLERIITGEKLRGEFVFNSNLLVQKHKLSEL